MQRDPPTTFQAHGRVAAQSSVLVAVAFAVAGCAFDSSVGTQDCVDGVERGGEICRNGTWVSVDADSTGGGGSPPPDGAASTDSTPPRDDTGRGDGCTGDACGDSQRCDETPEPGCPCTYDGDGDGSSMDEHGVCRNQTIATDGTCKRPANHISPVDDESNAGSGGEYCDGLDNDCDGTTDEKCPCSKQGATKPCGQTTGVCSKGTTTCNGSEWGPCMNNTGPSSEICDNRDNDCDGTTDEKLNQKCSKQTGVCSGSTIRCTNGGFSSCGPVQYGNAYESSEASCADGKDNDCDGKTDCADSQCTSCGPNTTCEMATCVETACDGKDNDSDGKTDEDIGTRSREGGAGCSYGCQCRSGVCTGGNCAHRIFTTSTRYDVGGTGAKQFNSVSKANSLCNSAAQSAGLGGTWNAILSDDSSGAAQKLTIDAAIYNLGGGKVADGRADFWDNSLDNPVEYDENGGVLTSPTVVWTGTNGDGSADKDRCRDQGSSWSSNDSLDIGESGRATRSNRLWLQRFADVDCGSKGRLYCIDGQ